MKTYACINVDPQDAEDTCLEGFVQAENSKEALETFATFLDYEAPVNEVIAETESFQLVVHEVPDSWAADAGFLGGTGRRD